MVGVANNVVTAMNRGNCSLVHYTVQVGIFPAGRPYPFNIWRRMCIKVRGKVRVKEERIRDVNITQNGQMLNLNISSYDFFLTQKQAVPEIVKRYNYTL
jgi:hypothetical protein